MNYGIPAFTKEEGQSYILEKLQGAGAARAIFEDAALEAILNASDPPVSSIIYAIVVF